MATFVFRNQIRNTLLVFICALMAMGGTAHAVVLGLQDGNATVSIDVDSQHGLFDWTTDGVNIAPVFGGGINDYRQWFWYRVGNNPEQSIDSLLRGVTGTTDANFDGHPDTAVVNYTGAPGFNIQVVFTLAGGTIGSGKSDIGEQIKITNTNATGNLDFHFFQYGDFQPTPPLVGGETVTFTNSNTVDERGGFGDIQETVHTPVASHQEAEAFPVTINELNDGAPTTLADNTAMGPGDITWCYQWDISIAPGQTYLISKDMQVVLVPEPATWALVTSAALLAVFMWSGKKRSLAAKPR